ncbi:PTS system D-mannitol-specific IIA component, Fru family /PTS system D-mannitol-specific IIB component, Fru family /PTS system D-mannitol-specific IIC component, Fru family [Arthrobacter sp. ov407]|uniref:PTS mannitol transporter subunit IICBA n=1 Tax=Arthrobacter sp. ov407 TaxID=1761748 RepID=UPI000887CE41|nr:PTS mannitol transporter subunit IICBA [Arthrobacter sp. ov407]SDL56404.1 PTS system D-mannitol-specific IIA component, Fru family /PTS system D-mannitol-specific IIB component, Fru family /PTS system D-mannitol-specific IIC component, Fru family [Arthrobacter sp. ov407]
MATETVAKPRTSVRVHVQKFGTFLSGMIMPNIAAFIAWGFITALFIPAGFFPNSELGKLVGPMITYMLPLLIGYTGGRMVYGVRGGVVGAVATMGVIVGTDIPMFIGAMILGPLTAWLMMKADKIWEGRVKPGFEMLIDNFSAGILAAAMAVVGMLVVGPIVKGFSNGASAVVEFLVVNGLLPFTSIFIEPAKVLFLNNAVNHGILTPLGTQQALEQGKSILFLLEANPGPGFGILLAFSFFGKGLAKASAPGAAVIQFVGGIHEIYFPYVLMKPMTIFAAIGGGMTGIFTLVVTGAGLRSPAAPGSIIAVYASTARDSYVGVTLSVLFATTVSFLIASVILKASKAPAEDDLDQATHRMEALKGKKSSVSAALIGEGVGASGVAVLATPIKNIVFACDAGMGSSAMGASVLRNKIKAAGFPDVKVTNSAIANLSDTYDVVITHQDLTERAKPATASAVHVSVDNFMNSPKYDEIVELVQASNTEAGTTDAGAAPAAAAVETPETPAAAEPDAETGPAGILVAESVVLNGTATTRDAAIDEAGQLLLDRGAVDSGYVDAMHEREESVSTYMGSFLAIPHGTNAAKDHIMKSAVSVIRYPNGIDWNGKEVKFVVGVAGINNEHLHILSSIAKVFTNKAQVAQLEAATTVDEVLALFGKVNS